MYLSTWTKNLKDPKEKAEFEQTIRSAEPVLERLGDLLSELETELDRTEIDIKTYDNPNWSHRQAHKNGYRACSSLIKRLINLDQQKGNSDQ